MGASILIAGPSGLIGSTALRMALGDARFSRVVALGRKPLDASDPRLAQWCHSDILQALRPERVDAVLCCLGTTIRKVGGDKARFAHVDRDLVLGIAQWARDHGTPTFCVVSAVGADAGSRVFYNRVKGEMEDRLKALALPTLHIFQPSILTGPRQEHRLGERIGITMGRVLAPLLPARYKPMPNDVLAAALLNAVFVPQGGTHTYAAIRRLSLKS